MLHRGMPQLPHISLCRELCQEDAVLLGDKMKSSVNQKCCFLLLMLAIKTCDIEANTTLSFEHGATNRAKLNFLSDIHWLNDIEPLIALFSIGAIWWLEKATVHIAYRLGHTCQKMLKT